jgi:Fe-S cluster assembly protein SufD
LGGAWVRQDLDVSFTGPGAEADCSGIYVVGGTSHLDNHTWLRHQAPNCTSRETYHGVLGGKAKAVFNGMVRIDRGAVGTDASLYNRNLLLSDHATVYAKPELEIFADDVKAAHGCTVGQLDPEQLTYLRSRGFDLIQARQLLTRAFLVRVLDAVKDDDLREVSNGLIAGALDKLIGDQS